MEYYIYIKLMPYEMQWLTHNYGDPVRFPSHSYENAEIKRQVQPLPSDKLPQTRKEGELAVVIPGSAYRKPSTYNYLSQSGRQVIESMLRNTIDRDFKKEVREAVERGSDINAAVRSYLERNGISIDHEETLKMRITRMRMAEKKRENN